MTGKAGVKLLQDALMNALAGEVSLLGFTPRMKQQKFVREMGDCTWVIHVGFARHQQDVDVTIDLAVLLVSVNQLFKKVGAEHWGTATIGAELGNLVDRRPRRWTVTSELDATTIAREMRSEIEKFGIDWLQRFSRLETVYETLAPNDLQSRLLMPLQVKRCAIVLTLALLLRTKEEAQQVFNECRSLLSSRAEPLMSTFDEYAARLMA